MIQGEVTGPNQAWVPVQEQILLGDALTNELDVFCESSIATSGLSAAMGLPAFDSDALLMSPSFGSQYDDQGFTSSSTEIDWSMLQESDGSQAQENTASDWFDSISSSFPQVGQQNANPAFDPCLFLPDPSPNKGAQECYLPNAHSLSSLLLPPDIVSSSDIYPPPSAPLTGSAVPHVMPPLVSISTQECHLHPPSMPIQLPANLSPGLLDGKGDEAVADERHDGQPQRDSGKKGGGGRKRKAVDALVGTKDDGTPQSKKHAKRMGETARQEAPDATSTTGTTEADMLEKEAKIAEEAAIKATKTAKAAKAAVKAAKEAREAAGPELARRSGRVSTLPCRLKGGDYIDYTRPKQVSLGKKDT